MGDRSDEWLNYKYKIGWKFIGIDTAIITPQSGWLKANLPSISLQPPLVQSNIEIALDKQLMEKQGIQSVRIRFASILFNKPYRGKTIVIRPKEADDPLKTRVYHDKDQPVVYQINWYTNQQTRQDDLKVLDDEFLFLVPPQL